MDPGSLVFQSQLEGTSFLNNAEQSDQAKADGAKRRKRKYNRHRNAKAGSHHHANIHTEAQSGHGEHCEGVGGARDRGEGCIWNEPGRAKPSKAQKSHYEPRHQLMSGGVLPAGTFGYGNRVIVRMQASNEE